MIFNSPQWLYLPYIANILLLIPVCYSLLLSGSSDGVFQGRVADSEGLRYLVASLYLTILMASIGGLFYPVFFAPLVLIQIVYKALWLVSFILPLIQRGDPIPSGIAISFIVIVVTYPVFYWLAWR